MSLTLLGLAIGAGSAALKALQESGVNWNAVAKMSKPAVMESSRKIQKKMDDYSDAHATAGWVENYKYGQTVLYKSYMLPSNRSLYGVENAVYKYFRSLWNVSVSKYSEGEHRIIKCKAKPPRKYSGLKLNLIVSLQKVGEEIRVWYQSPINEDIETIQALCFSIFFYGAGKLLGQKLRHDVPLGINSAIEKYLSQGESDRIWKELVSIACGREHTVGLKKDGTAVAVGNNKNGQCDIETWKELIAIACGPLHTVGLKKNGTAVAVGNNHDNECKVRGWKDLIAVACGHEHTVGLKKDGTAVAVGGELLASM